MNLDYTACYCSSFICCYEKYPDKKATQRTRFYFSSRFKVVFHHFKKVTVAELGTAGHIVCSARNKRMKVCVLTGSAQCQCSYIVQDPFLGNGAAHMGLGLFTSVSLIKIVPHSQPRSQPNPPLKFSSQVILGPV